VVGELLRTLAPQVLGPLARRSARFEDAEDAVQEALLAATVQWPVEGLPDEPRAWLRTVAARRLADRLRSEAASRRREERDAARIPADAHLAPAPDGESDVATGVDDTLVLLLLCCHPTLSPSSQVALTLRAVGGLTTAEIARSFLVPEATMGQRISRAKGRIRASGARFALPVGAEVPTRWAAALHVLYLIFSEGSTATSGADLHRPDLTAEAIRLARLVRRLRPDDGEAAGLLALMLLVEARRAARIRADGRLVPLAEQDRALWDGDRIAEGVALLTHALPRATLGPYQLQAAIAAVHAEAPSAAATDWRQVVALYRLLDGLAPSPVVTLNRAVAVAMADGPEAGLALLAPLADDERLAGHHRLPAVRAHLREMAGDRAGAEADYRTAARLTTSLPEQRYLRERAAGLVPTTARCPVTRPGGSATVRFRVVTPGSRRSHPRP
jgi:RNA polymerase sigma factor (sigma-70 family)